MSSNTSTLMISVLLAFLSLFALVTEATPLGFEAQLRARTLAVRPRTTDPYFPADVPSCPKCEADYGSIQHCAAAAPVLQNFSMIIFNPGAFIDVIQCACTETFQSVFPQCVDCFQKTNQTDVINTDDLPSVVAGMKQICALESALLGNVSGANSETLSATSAAATAQASDTAMITQIPLALATIFAGVGVILAVTSSGILLLQ